MGLIEKAKELNIFGNNHDNTVEVDEDVKALNNYLIINKCKEDEHSEPTIQECLLLIEKFYKSHNRVIESITQKDTYIDQLEQENKQLKEIIEQLKSIGDNEEFLKWKEAQRKGRRPKLIDYKKNEELKKLGVRRKDRARILRVSDATLRKREREMEEKRTSEIEEDRKIE